MLVMRLQQGARSHFVTRMPEWVLSITLGAFSAQLLTSHDAFSHAIAYRLLSRFVTQSVWGVYAGVIALTWFSALTINGIVPRTRRWTPLVRMTSAFFASSFWAVNSWFYMLTVPGHPGVVNNSGFAAMAVALCLIIAREVGVVEGKARNGR